MSEQSTDIEPLKVYVGWDSREDIAFQVCKQSILDNATVPVEVIPLKQGDLRKEGIYKRDVDAMASTEFTFTRFLVPHLADYKGWALFIDCDFVFLDDIKKLFDQADDKYAVMCAHHDYSPKQLTKMDGQAQHIYPRKNWSSCVLFNCQHIQNGQLNLDLVNNPGISGAYLHRFSWLDDNLVGEFSHEWNWLVGWYEEPQDGTPKALHYTEGGPWFEQYENCDYAYHWYKARISYAESLDLARAEALISADNKRQRLLEKFEVERLKTTTENLVLPDQKKKLVNDFIHYLKDPKGTYYPHEHNWETIMALREPRVAALEPGDDDYGFKPEKKGFLFDEYLEAFVLGADRAKLSSWEKEKDSETTLIIRGLGKESQLALKECMKTGREYYYIDSGYMGNETTKSKIYHRITKNGLQNTGPIFPRSRKRLEALKYRYTPFKMKGEKILLVPPSDKVMKFWGQETPNQWVAKVSKELKQYTDRPIEVRLKPKRNERIADKNILYAFRDNVYCVVTYNSIAATEALLNGIPAIALGNNAASVLCNSKLSDINNLYTYDEEQMLAYAAHLSYCQFTRREMQDGTAWAILNQKL